MNTSFRSSSTSKTVNSMLFSIISPWRLLSGNLPEPAKNAKRQMPSLLSSSRLLKPGHGQRFCPLEIFECAPAHPDCRTVRDRERETLPAGGVGLEQDLRPAGSFLHLQGQLRQSQSHLGAVLSWAGRI